jgi:hypothetical protein
VVPKDQAQRKKIRKVVSTARNLVTSLLNVQICRRTSQRRSKRKQASNLVASKTRTRKVLWQHEMVLTRNQILRKKKMLKKLIWLW